MYEMEIRVRARTSATPPPPSNWPESWSVRRGGKKNSCPQRKSNPDSSVAQPSAYSLQWSTPGHSLVTILTELPHHYTFWATPTALRLIWRQEWTINFRWIGHHSNEAWISRRKHLKIHFPPQSKHAVSITNINQLIMYREIINVYC